MPGKLVALPPEIGSRLKALRERLGLKQSDFAQLTGITQATLSRMERGIGPISAEAIYGILSNWPDTDVHALMCGSPSPVQIPVPADALEVASNVRPVIRALGAPVDDLPEERVADDYLAVPLVEGRVAAGAGAVAWDRIMSLVWVYRPEVGRRRNLVAVKVWGDSMHPTVPHDAIIIIDRDQRWPQGNRHAIWAVRTGPEGDLAIKRLQRADGILLLMSDNPDHAPMVAWTKDLEKLVVGRVIWMWRSLEK